MNKVNGHSKSHSKPAEERAACKHCGKKNHSNADCRFKDAECHVCHKRGHIRAVCRQKQSVSSKSATTRKSTQNKVGVDSCSSGEPTMYHTSVSNSSVPAIQVDFTVVGKQLSMEVDTGATYSVVGHGTFNRLWNHSGSKGTQERDRVACMVGVSQLLWPVLRVTVDDTASVAPTAPKGCAILLVG